MRPSPLWLLLPLLVGCGARQSAQAPKPPKSEEVTFKAADGGKVYADLYRAGSGRADSVVLMFHQARSSAAEYYPIAPRVAKLGFDCLAVDQRSGGDMYGLNRTAKEFSSDQGYLDAYADMQGAMNWARSEGYKSIVAWGSSYSASLCFRLASENPDLRAVVAFSPGEYFADKSAVSSWMSKPKLHALVICTDEEAMAVSRMVDAARNPLFHPELLNGSNAVHGSSTLRSDKNPDGAEVYWRDVERFLNELPHFQLVDSIKSPDFPTESKGKPSARKAPAAGKTP